MARYVTKAELAAHFQVSTRTVDSWHGRGFVTGYRDLDGAMRFNLQAVELAMRMNPFSMRDGRKRGKRGVVVPMPVPGEGASE